MAAAPKTNQPKSSSNSIFDQLGLKPLTQENLLHHYAPLAGAASYTGLAVNLSSPNVLKRLFPNRDVTNVLLLSSIAGTALYIHNRPHLKKAPNKMRIAYSVYGAGMLSLSSVLVWAIIRSFLPENCLIHTATGVASSVGLLLLGKQYLEFIDKNVLEN